MLTELELRRTIVPKPAALPKLCISRAGFDVAVRKGVMVRPFKIGERKTALTAHEIQTLNAARIRGATEDELRAIVKQLHAERLQTGLQVEAPGA